MRRFNEKALAEFSSWVACKGNDSDGLQPFRDMLFDESATEHVEGTSLPANRKPGTRYEIGRSFLSSLGDRKATEFLDDDSIMSWTSVYFSDSTFFKPSGQFFIGDKSRHILSSHGDRRLNRRHLVGGAAQIVHEHGVRAEPTMTNHPSSPSKLEDNYLSHRGPDFLFLRSPGFMDAVVALFFSPPKGYKPLTQEHFAYLARTGSQLDAVYDLGSMDKDSILDLLDEYRKWPRSLSKTI